MNHRKKEMSKFSNSPVFGLFILMASLIQTGAITSSCPKACSCSKEFKMVSCRNQKLDKVPDGIPIEVTELYLSYNQFTIINESFLPELQNLTVLALNNNNITEIKDRAFVNIGNLSTLFLTQNKLSSVTKEAFTGLEKLQDIYVGQNKLTTIPDFSETPNISKIVLDMNKITSAKFTAGPGGLQKVTRVILGQNPIMVLKSSDFSALKGSSVGKFDLNHCSLTYVENDTFLPFKTLQSLSLSYNNLTKDAVENVISSLKQSKIVSLDFSNTMSTSVLDSLFNPLENSTLKTLKMAHCKLTVLQNGLFAPLSKLEYLDLSYSEIANIEEGTFSPLVSLKTLLVQNNRLNAFPTPLPSKISVLDLSHNYDLQEVPKNAFPPWSNLTTLKLGNCRFLKFHKESFQYLTQLKSLDLSNNQISETSIAKDTFLNMTSLETLDLSRNMMNKITTNVGQFNGLSFLKMFNFSINHCSQLPDKIFHPMFQLEILDLESNSLGIQLSNDEDGILFSNFTRLTEINLSRNEIPLLTSNVFQWLRNISHLHLNNNRITHWEPDTFKKTTNMTFLDLSTNSIPVINSTSVKYFTANLSLNINDNPFSCWCDLIWFRNWINTTKVHLVDVTEYHCTSPREMADLSLLQFDPNSIQTRCHPPYKWIIIGAAMVTSFLCLIIGIILYRLRWKILVCCYRCRTQKNPSEEGRPLLRPSPFNATISYDRDSETESWVKRTLWPKLNEYSLNPFSDHDAVLPGSTYNTQFEQLDEALLTSKFAFVVMCKDYIKRGRCEAEINFVNENFDKSRGRLHIFPIIYVQQNTGETRIRAYIEKNIRHRCPQNHILTWSDDEDVQETFWRRLDDKIKTVQNQLGN